MNRAGPRIVAALAAAAALGAMAGCGKKKAVTEPLVIDSTTFAGAWTGCTTEPGIQCSAVSMTLSDSSLTDSTALVTGTGNWGDEVVITGHADTTRVTLTGTTTGVLRSWTFVGMISGDTLRGNMTIPGVDSAYTTVFTRTP